MPHCAKDYCRHHSQRLEWKTSPDSWSIGIGDLKPGICYNWRMDYHVTCWTCPRPCISHEGGCKFFYKTLVILLSVSRERKLIQLLVIISLAYFKWLFPFITAALPYLFLLACNISLNHDKRWKVRRRKPSIGDGRLFGRVPVGERQAYYVPPVPMSYILSWQFRGCCCLVRYIDFITPTWCIFGFPNFFHLGWTN